ncbi:hypothetical protein WJX79_008828 [Trebouxia sp. C0005]
MPVSWRKLVLPSVILKLLGRSPHASVVSGGPTELEAPGGLFWDGEDITQGESAHQDRVSPAYEAAGQYDLALDVILRGEFISEQQSKAVIVCIRLATYIGVTILVIALAYKIAKTDLWFTSNIAVQAWNVSLGALCFAALSTCCIILASRVLNSHRQRKHWSRRRKVTVALNGAELCVQLVNVCVWVAPNAILLRHNCQWFEPFVIWTAFTSWTCWNTIFLIMLIEAHNCAPWDKGRAIARGGKRSRDAIVMDAPIWYHTPKLILWCIFEALNLFLAIWITHDQVGPVQRKAIISTPNCAVRAQNCRLETVTLVLVILICALLILYIVLWFWYMWRAYRDLQKHQYMHYKMGNLNVRMQAHRRLIAAALFLVSFVVLQFVKINSCSSYMESWLGFAPVYVVETAVAVGGAYFFMPKNPDLQDPILRVWLQEFGWTEEEKAAKIGMRGGTYGPVHDALKNEPMFCFGTAVKLFYWSHLVYDMNEEGSRRFSIETALGLFGLDKYELMWEKAEDTKVLLAWNTNTVLVSFRGTASLANALADIQVWMSHYPGKRQGSKGEGPDLLAGPATAFSWLPGGRPAVHRGFLNSWRANGLNQRVKQRVWDILYSKDVDRNNVKVLCTGHSLGGALASLAAFDIRRHCPCLKPMDVSCYTFGAPRVGNHAFARQYDVTVPDTWNIINNQDVIARAGRFLGLYKRAGQRVMINPSGDLIVRPTFIEAAAQVMRPWGGILGGSVPDHLLVNYRKSLVAICLAQFNSTKGFEGGGKGVLQLLETAEIRDVLATAGVQFEQLRRMGPFGGVVLQLQGIMQKGFKTVDPDADTAVVCTDGVCRLVPVTSLKRGSRPTVLARSHSMPNGRPSGSQSGSSARQCTQSARRFDIESADSDDDGIDVEVGRLSNHAGEDGTVCSQAEVVSRSSFRKASSLQTSTDLEGKSGEQRPSPAPGGTSLQSPADLLTDSHAQRSSSLRRPAELPRGSHAKTSNNVFLPASATFAVFLTLLTIFIIVRYGRSTLQGKRTYTAKRNGREPRRSTRERKEVSRWSPERKGTHDSPSAHKKTPKTPASAAVQKVMANTEGALASPISAVKKTRLAKSLGATATSPSPPKLRSR